MHEPQVPTVIATVTTLIPVELRQRGVAVRGVVLPGVAELLDTLTKLQGDYLRRVYIMGEGRESGPEEALTARQRSTLRRLALGRRASARGVPAVEGLMVTSWRRLVGGVLLRTAMGALPVLLTDMHWNEETLKDGTLRVVLL